MENPGYRALGGVAVVDHLATLMVLRDRGLVYEPPERDMDRGGR
jgi:hypothetical protein